MQAQNVIWRPRAVCVMLNAEWQESSLNSFSLHPKCTQLAFCQDIQLHADCGEIRKCSDKSDFPGFHIYLFS